MSTEPMWIMVAGPYRSGSRSREDRNRNLAVLNEAALAVWRKGHVPVIGVNNAQPLIDIAGEEHFDAIMMPVSLAFAARCDACLRIGGPSNGADQEMDRFLAVGKPVFRGIEDVPDLSA